MAYDRVDGVSLRMANQYVHHGVVLQLDQDLAARASGRSDRPSLTYGQAVAYQIIRDQDVALAAYMEDVGNAQ